jgi:hypothetical protein
MHQMALVNDAGHVHEGAELAADLPTQIKEGHEWSTPRLSKQKSPADDGEAFLFLS